MSNRAHTFAILGFAVALLGNASASETATMERDHIRFDVPAVIGAAYHDPRIATNADEVRRQGGFTTLIATTGNRWQSPARTIDLLPIVGAAYHDPRIATNAGEVRRQGGFATAGVVRWRAPHPAGSMAKATDVGLGAL